MADDNYYKKLQGHSKECGRQADSLLSMILEEIISDRLRKYLTRHSVGLLAGITAGLLFLFGGLTCGAEAKRKSEFKKEYGIQRRDLNGDGTPEVYYAQVIQGGEELILRNLNLRDLNSRYVYSVDGESLEELLNKQGKSQEKKTGYEEYIFYEEDLNGNGLYELFYVIDGHKYFCSIDGQTLNCGILPEELAEKLKLTKENKLKYSICPRGHRILRIADLEARDTSDNLWDSDGKPKGEMGLYCPHHECERVYGWSKLKDSE